MAIPGQFPPNLIFTIGILQPVKWTHAAKRARWSEKEPPHAGTSEQTRRTLTQPLAVPRRPAGS
jgi:hypothetical protein